MSPLYALTALALLMGCGSLEVCLDDCEDGYDACLESGRSEGGCKTELVACKQVCEDEALKNDRNGETSDLDNRPTPSVVR